MALDEALDRIGHSLIENGTFDPEAYAVVKASVPKNFTIARICEHTDKMRDSHEFR